MKIKYEVVANVRKVGAIGKFYPVIFQVECNDELDKLYESTNIDAKDQWFDDYSQRWELYNFISIKEIK